MKKIKLLGGLFIILNFLILVGAQPDYFDWRDNNGNWMTSVKHQYDCGSCWAFSAVGTVEAQYNIAENNSNFDLDLSEEQLISCCNECWAYSEGGCYPFQRQYTRTCTPSGCAEETNCTYDETCIPAGGGDILTVCKGGGCDYTNIQDALDDAGTHDMIRIDDEGVYEEDLYWTASGDYITLNCDGATISPWSFGVRVGNGEDTWAIINCIFNGSVGVVVNGTDGGSPYEILNSVFDVEEKGVKFDGEFSGIDIKDNVFVNAEEEGV